MQMITKIESGQGNGNENANRIQKRLLLPIKRPMN